MKTVCSHIGYYAHQVLERSKGALVSGVASRGIYLQPEDDWTLYLSLEKYRGPLTINLGGHFSWRENIKTGHPVHFISGKIRFPMDNVSISYEDADIWRSALNDGNREFIFKQMDSVLNLSKKLAAGNPYLSLLFENPVPIPDVPGLTEKILNLRTALKDGDLERITSGSTKLLGLGPGLTPLGDDFILGVLLTFNYCGISNLKGHNLKKINQIIIQHAREKTTRLSSSLLVCASEGAADERLLIILDGICSGNEITEGALRDLLAWGSSSGIAVLAGMMAVLT